MSRLWPEHFTIGLFSDGCWIRSARRFETIDNGVADMHAIGPVFERAIAQIIEVQKRTRQVDVLLSDRLARTTLLPWQEQILSPAQLRAYAQACFERAGVDVNAAWSVNAGFRHFRSRGLAVGVPAGLLEALSGTAQAHGVALRSATPVTAAAYWRHVPGLRSRHSALFLCEEDRLTLLQSHGQQLVTLDVQPAAGDLGLALRRLVLRQAGPMPAQVSVWCAQPGAPVPPAFAEQFADMPIRLLAGADWMRR